MRKQKPERLGNLPQVTQLEVVEPRFEASHIQSDSGSPALSHYMAVVGE